jgi:acetyl-CoA carboxylase biotin carboxylase subunit
MRRALSEYVVTGVRTNLAFLARLMNQPLFARGEYDTAFLERHLAELVASETMGEAERRLLSAAIAVAAHLEEMREHRVLVPAPVSGWTAAHRARLR